MCLKYCLYCEKVDFKGVMKVIIVKWLVVIRFWFIDDEWDSFGKFFKSKLIGILIKKEIDIIVCFFNVCIGGYVVVLISFNSECL